MATFLQPDKIRIETIGGQPLIIKEKIIPDTARATRAVASYVQKGQPMKPNAPLGGDGKPRGITLHNTNDILVPTGTTPAEQYTRATWPNQNMAGVCVHFYVWGTDIWQSLRENERGWHATDGSSRRAAQRKGQTIGGNLDTIAIECIGSGKSSEDTATRLVAYLLRKYGLSPEFDLYPHRYFYPAKNCPAYILPHWETFLALVKSHCNASGSGSTNPAALPKLALGDIVRFAGGSHYASANAAQPTGGTRSAGLAKITRLATGGKYPYHLIGEKNGSNVYGWVDGNQILDAGC